MPAEYSVPMAITVSTALNLQVFQGVEVRVLTGAEHLTREIRWVHASELPDIATFLSGGELLLTAGLGMGHTATSQRQYVKSIAQAGAIALVIEESGRMFERVPQTVVEEAARNELPVLALGQEIPFAAVSTQVHELLAEERVHRLKREREIEAAFSDLLFQGADSMSIIRELARMIQAPVVLENIVRKVIAYVGRTPQADQIIDTWTTHSREAHPPEHSCRRRTVMMRGQPWGWIHLPLGSKNTDDLDDFALERAATAVAISLLTDRTTQARHDQRSTSLITRLILGDLTGTEFVDRARSLGYSLGNESLVALVLHTSRDSPAPDPTEPRPFISADLDDYSLTILPTVKLEGPAVTTMIRAAAQGGGISRMASADSLPTAITQAQSAAAVSRTRPGTPVIRFEELGVERLLVNLAQGPELAAFVEDELGPLLEWDATSSIPLLPTLRAFLDADGNKSVAAQHLFIQRRTLYNRLDRISGLLGRPLTQPATRQGLLLAVKGLDLLDNGRSS